MPLAPGVSYLARRVPQLLAPPAAVCAASYVARAHFGAAAPAWALALAYVLCYPLAFTAYIQWRDFKNARAAAAAGAVIPPVVEAKWIGGFDLMKRAGADFDKHILGMWVGVVGQWTVGDGLRAQGTGWRRSRNSMATRSTSARSSSLDIRLLNQSISRSVGW